MDTFRLQEKEVYGDQTLTHRTIPVSRIALNELLQKLYEKHKQKD